MCKFEGKWIGSGYIYTKKVLDCENNFTSDLIKTKDNVEININKVSNNIYEIKVNAILVPDYTDYFLGFYNHNAKTIQAIHHTPTNETNGISNFYIKKNKLYN